MFRNREEAAERLARLFAGRMLRDPLVLGIPRGGVVLAAVLARELNAELDIVLARKLRAPNNPELAIGAVSADGSVYIEPVAAEWVAEMPGYLREEIHFQKEEIARRRKLLCGDRSAPRLAGRSIIVTDDGIATGSTMMAALQGLARENPHEVIVAVPVASPDRLPDIRSRCDEVLCLMAPPRFQAIGEFYRDFRQVEDDEVVALLAREPHAAEH
jgi:predicted phosphoribosyltransferase